MKNRRSASGPTVAAKGAAPHRPSLPPPLLDPLELEALAASANPSLEGAWWIALQVTEHLLSSVALTDPRTGAFLPQSLHAILAALSESTAEARRPFPRDQLFVAAEMAAGPLAKLLDHHRTRIVRTHQQLPFHQLREVDSHSLAWLAKLPGRTVREKLSGRTHALGVKRARTADTAENRLVRAFARLLVRRGTDRLTHADAYDRTSADAGRAEELTRVVRLCDEEMRRSDLGDIPAVARLQPNNVLLGDPQYSRVFRAWMWLRDADEDLGRAWAKAPDRVGAVLFWLTVARLASLQRALVGDTLGRIVLGRDGASFGVEVLGSTGGATSWASDPEIDLLIAPSRKQDQAFLIRLSRHGEFLLARIAPLVGSGLLSEESVETLYFEMKLAADPLTPGRGIPLIIDGIDSTLPAAKPTFADAAGLRACAERIADTLLQHCAVKYPVFEPPRLRSTGVASHALVGIELASATLRVNDGTPRSVAVRGWTVAHAISGADDSAEWLDGRSDRLLASGVSQRVVWSLGTMLDPEPRFDTAVLALATRRVVSALARELDQPTAQIACAVPDSIDEFSQRSLRSAVSAAFPHAIPVWRSVAAALAWQLSPSFRDGGARSGDHVIVVDTELSSATLTLLVARHDGKLEREFPRSRGIYWERRPPMSPNDQVELLGWQRLLRLYASVLVERAVSRAPGGPSVEQQRSVVEDLVRTGAIARLVESGVSLFVPLHRAGNASAPALKIDHDRDLFGDEVDSWIDALARAIVPELNTLAASSGGATHLLLAGGPCALPRFAERGIPRLQSGLDRRRSLRVASVPGPGIAAGARDCLARRDARCFAWKEWLPDLSLEIVHDGHYAELPLLNGDTSVDPFLGAARTFEVPETLRLPRGKSWYSFPLIMGREGGRPLAWEARLESTAFPLEHDARAVLKLSYSYGLETSYVLVLEPESPEKTPFTRIEARWIRAFDTADPASPQEGPVFLAAPWNEIDAAKFAEGALAVARLADEKFARFLFAVTRACWAQGRSLATAPASVRTVFPRFLEALLCNLSTDVDPQNIPRALEILSLLHEDAPADVGASVLAIDSAARDDPQAYRKTARMLSTLVGDGAGERAVYLERLLDRLGRYSSYDTFNAGMTSTTMAALAVAVWRHPGLIDELGKNGVAVDLLLGQCCRTLKNLLAKVPSSIKDDEERERVSRLYGGPFRDATELLLALLRLRTKRVAPQLGCGTASADAITKAVRQLDARFSRGRVSPRWRVHLQVEIPESLRRMSAVAYSLNTYLSEGAGANLVHVTGADGD